MILGTTRRGLMVAFGGSFVALLLLGAAAFYLVLLRDYRLAYDHHLDETRQLASNLYQFDRGEFPTGAATIAHIMNELVTFDRSVTAFDSTGKRIGTVKRAPTAPDLSRISPVGIGSTPVTREMAGMEVRLMTIALPEGITLVVGVSDSEYRARVHSLRVALGIGLPILLILGVLLGARLAEPVLRAQRDFLGDVAHELRTPIAIIRAEADAGQAAGSRERATGALAAIGNEAGRMGNLVADLLLLARDERGDPTESEPLHLDEVANSAIQRTMTLPEARGRTIRLGNWEETPATGDPQLLERAVLALLHNSLVHVDAGDITVAVGSDAAEAWISVSDEGSGIPERERGRVFERGVRLQSRHPGSGLGLPIVQLILKRHGGRVTIDGDGSGTTVTLRLPQEETHSSS